DPAGWRGLPGLRTGRALCWPMGDRAESEAPEDDHEDGRAQVQERGGRDQRADGLLPGLQHGQGGDAGGVPPAGGRGRSGKLRRGVAMAGMREARRSAPDVGSQPAPARAVRAEGSQATAQALRMADGAKAGDAQTIAGAIRCGSRLTPFGYKPKTV